MLFLFWFLLCLGNYAMGRTCLSSDSTLKDVNIISENKYKTHEETDLTDLQKGSNKQGVRHVSSELTPQFGNKNTPLQPRVKRFTLNAGKWRKKSLAYRIMSYPPGIPEEDVRKEFQRAYSVWASFSDLRFTYKRKESNAQLTIEFPTQSHHPNCNKDFDGKGNVLAHTFPPMLGGAMHFDPAEMWTINSTTGADIFTVAVHEIGHSLGLSHSTHPESLMAPIYKPNEEYYYPSADDIEGIQEIYGPIRKIRRRLFATDTKVLCGNFTYDIIFTDKNREKVYVFSGSNYWVLQNDSIKAGCPRRISGDWLGLPGDLDAAFTCRSGETYFFKGKKHWKYRGYRMLSGYPRLIRRGFPGSPNFIDTAFETVDEDAVYFLKGNSSWKYRKDRNRVVAVKYINEIWSNLPGGVTAALPTDDGGMYFFKGNIYYKFKQDGLVMPAIPEYPRSWQHWWLKCPNWQNGTIVTWDSK